MKPKVATRKPTPKPVLKFFYDIVDPQTGRFRANLGNVFRRIK